MKSLSEIYFEGRKIFCVMWGIAPPSSLKGKKGREIESHIRAQTLAMIEGMEEWAKGFETWTDKGLDTKVINDLLAYLSQEKEKIIANK